MSSLERNKGSLVEIGKVEDFQHSMDEDDLYDYLEDKGMLQIGDKIYTVAWEVKSDYDSCDFCDITEDDLGVIHFHSVHYNGGASLEEVLEEELKKL